MSALLEICVIAALSWRQPNGMSNSPPDLIPNIETLYWFGEDLALGGKEAQFLT
jgi:hypothetical protein